MAYYDSNMTIFGFYYDTESEDWVFKGKVRSHYKEVCNILFLDEEPYGLYTIGKDRHLIKYTDIAANEEELDISTRDRIEQKDIPIYFIPYPRRKFSKCGYFLVADDKVRLVATKKSVVFSSLLQHKYKTISTKTMMCTSVYLGPAYGCFRDSPVSKMEFLPRSNKKYLIFMTKKQIGIQLMSIDGNPFKYVGCLGHPEELVDFRISFDGKYVFTFGKNDRTVFMWKVKIAYLPFSSLFISPQHSNFQECRNDAHFRGRGIATFLLSDRRRKKRISLPGNARSLLLHANPAARRADLCPQGC
jgi:WD40 repeat protein